MSCKCTLRKKITDKNLRLNSNEVYLDYCATTKPDIDVLSFLEAFNRNSWGNISAQNIRGIELYNKVEFKLAYLKKLLALNDYNIQFDYSASLIASKIRENCKNCKIVTTNIEHNSLLAISDFKLKVTNNGKININHLYKLKSTNKIILIYAPVNHETGNIQPYKEIYEICKKLGISVIFDAVQTVTRLNIQNWKDFCDGFYFSGHKIHGLQGSAAIITKENIIEWKNENAPVPFSLTTGTLNSGDAMGLLEAFTLCIKNFKKDNLYITNLHKEAIDILKEINGITFESSPKSAPGIINFSLPMINDIEDLLLYLNKEGICLSRFSACTGDIKRPSSILTKMGRPEERCSTSLRVSFGKYSKRDDFFKLKASILSYIRLQLKNEKED